MFESDPVCISKSSKHYSEMFDYFALFTTSEGQKRNYEKMSAPSVRPEVMADPGIQKDTIMKVFGAVMAEAGPLVLPANFRETEYFKTIDERLQLVWLGEQKVAQMIDDLQKEAQAILDKPSLEAKRLTGKLDKILRHFSGKLYRRAPRRYTFYSRNGYLLVLLVSI